MPNRFVARHGASVRSALRYAATLLLIAAALVACTVWPTLRGWWETVVPAALASAIAALLVFAVVVNTPLEASFPSSRCTSIATSAPGRCRAALAAPSTARRRCRSSSRPTPLRTLQSPEWHAPEAALPVLERLLAERPSDPSLAYLQAALRAAVLAEAKFYFNVLSWGGGTNARVEALRRGDTSVLRSS